MLSVVVFFFSFWVLHSSHTPTQHISTVSNLLLDVGGFVPFGVTTAISKLTPEYAEDTSSFAVRRTRLPPGLNPPRLELNFLSVTLQEKFVSLSQLFLNFAFGLWVQNLAFG